MHLFELGPRAAPEYVRMVPKLARGPDWKTCGPRAKLTKLTKGTHAARGPKSLSTLDYTIPFDVSRGFCAGGG